MKKLNRQALRFLLCSAIICGAFAVAPIGPSGCASYNPPALTPASTDQIILRAEQAAEAADLTFNTFVHLERDNQQLLSQAGPAIHEWANTVRRNGQDWVRTLRSATKTFKANRNAENQATLQTALATLINLTNKTNQYISQAKKITQP